MASVARRRLVDAASLGVVRIAFLYTRVSTDEQGDNGLSLDTQEARGLDYIKREDWQYGGTFTDVMSGRRDDRPGYQAVLREIRSAVVRGLRPVLVVSMLDRLGRKLKTRIEAWEELRDLGVPLHSADHGEWDELSYNLLSAVAQDESRRTAERVRQVRERGRELGWHESGRAPWGYRWRPATVDERGAGAPRSVLEIHRDVAPSVREAWSWLADGESLCEIARWASSLPESARGGRNLNFGVIRTTFRAPVYVARIGGRFEIEETLDQPVGRWEPLVSDEDWLRVRANVDKAKRRLPAQASGRYLLTGFLKCDRCGSRMAGSIVKPNRKNPRGYRQYVCTGGRVKGAKNDATCRSHSIAADRLDEIVLRTVRELLGIAADPHVIDAAEAAWADIERRQTQHPDVERGASLDRDIAKTRTRMQRNHTLFVDGDITKDAYLSSQAEYQRELDALCVERERLKGRAPVATLPSFWVVLEQVRGWYGALTQTIDADPNAARAALAELLESVTPVPTGRFGRYQLAPAWTTTGRVLMATAIRFGASANVAHVDSFGTTNISTSLTWRAA